MTSLLDSKVHTFLLTWLLTQQVTGLTETLNLDMAPNAFDDEYDSCVKETERKAPQLLQEGYTMNGQLNLEWKNAEQRWKEIKNTMSYPKGFHDFHGIALVAYTGYIHQDFNKAVREFKKNPGYEVYHKVITTASGEGYDKIVLDSPERKRSNFNCFYSGSTDTSHFSSSELVDLLPVQRTALGPAVFRELAVSKIVWDRMDI
ncbi:hypothetical protein STEG23_018580 [Scotinomys teguina]